MAKYPEMLRALSEQEDQTWAFALAAAREIATTATGRVAPGEYQSCADWLAENGYTVTTGWIADMRATGVKFSTARSRRHKVKFRLYVVAATSAKLDTPEKRDKSLADAAKNGYTLREYNETVTGRPWADSVQEKVRSAAREQPELITEVLRQNPQLVAQAVIDPEVAQAVVADREAEGAILRAQGSRAGGGGHRQLERGESMEPFARALTMLNLMALRQDAEAMQKAAVRDFSGQFVWRPGVKEKVLAELDAVAEIIGNVRTVLTTEVSDETLAEFLKN